MHRALSSKQFVPSLPHDGIGAFGIHLQITGMCSVLLCLHAEQSVSGFEKEAVSSCKILKISVCCVLFVHSWMQDREHITTTYSVWCLCAASVALQKVSFKNKLSFHRFLHFPRFYIHFNWPPREGKVWISLC
jgi:hypothetical protein